VIAVHAAPDGGAVRAAIPETMTMKSFGNLILMTLICIVIFWVFMALRPAKAAAVIQRGNEGWHIELSPLEFDRPFDGKLEIIYDDDDPCSATASRFIAACTRGRQDFNPQPSMQNPGRCVIRLVRRAIEWSNVNVEDVIRHETAHCNGWRHDAIIPYKN
jgi:hypothetical protein